LPLVLICILGWGLALWGQSGREIRDLAVFSRCRPDYRC